MIQATLEVRHDIFTSAKCLVGLAHGLTFLQVDEQRRTLDENGLRYLIALRSFMIYSSQGSAPQLVDTDAVAPVLAQRTRLKYRDMVWAFHSESQEMLLGAAETAYSNKLTWPAARAMGMFLWLRSHETIVSPTMRTMLALRHHADICAFNPLASAS